LNGAEHGVSESNDKAAGLDEEDADNDGAEAGEIPVDFNIFVLSLNAQALIHLGESAGPEGRAELNLPMARHTIDMLCMLETKTRGNLTGSEERLLHQVLFDLRLRFANKAK
jgi:hypothetical protein